MRHALPALLLLLSFSAGAQPTLTEDEAVRLGLARTGMAGLRAGSVETAQADAMAAATLPNPVLAYSRDRLQGAAGLEETWQVAQTLDVSGRRALRIDAAGRRVDAASATSDAREADVAAEIRRRFYEVVLKQSLAQAAEGWVARFSRIEALVQKLARAGDASGYDRRRLARERESGQAKTATELADLDRARERLAALMGIPGRFEGSAAGTLVPPAPPPIDATLARLDERADLRALARRAEAADLEVRAAERGWIPDVTVGLGAKTVDDGPTRSSGPLVTLSIPLPLFDRQQARGHRSAAEALSARAEYQLARTRAEGELRGLRLQLGRLIESAAAYRLRAVGASPDLLRIAESAYQGGESTLLELLDAYRGALEAELTALNLEARAREASIEFDLIAGRSVK